MFMSMFSTVDALCAEAIGQKVHSSWGKYSTSGTTTAAATKPAADPALSSSAISSERSKLMKWSSSSSSSSPPPPNTDAGDKKPQHKPLREFRRRGPIRFAPELDGVNCFESIVPC